jgi:uncharacterized protein (DUF58 family)
MRQIRRLQLRARRAVQTLLGGEYHSVFKGTGLSFEEVREYQPGDDVRTIDWNVTARMGAPFIKRFVEERELTVLLAVDVSGSQRFGTQRHTKRAVAAEVAALIAFSAVANNDASACRRQRRSRAAPAAGRNSMRCSVMIFFTSRGGPAQCKSAFDFLNQARRRAIVFLSATRCRIRVCVSTGGARPIAVRVPIPGGNAPSVGLVEVRDAETGKPYLINTRRASVRDAYARAAIERKSAFTSLARSGKVDMIDVSTDGTHFDALVRFFRLRESRRRHGR